MIGFLRGQVLAQLSEHMCLIENQGLGYEVDMTHSALALCHPLGQTVEVHIHQVIREDGHFLFGFSTLDEKRTFRQLIKISGVGPKLALTLLSHLSLSGLAQCARTNNLTLLQAVPGVGKKTAERIAIELTSKAFEILFANVALDSSSTMSPSPRREQEAIDALMGLGYKANQATHAVGQVASADLSIEEIIRLALQGMPA